MIFTVFFRRADGKGTQAYMPGLSLGQARRIKRQVFDRDQTKTMVWVLDENGIMQGDPLWRDEDEYESDRIARAT